VPHTLLLADDSVTIQRVIELTFADEDVKVIAVSDGDQAIERLESTPPDIVLADIGMPGKSGYEVARYVKQSPKLSHIPVVLLTGAFEPVDQARASEAGCDGVLAKPFEPQLVIGRVKELLAKAKPASAAAAEHGAASSSNGSSNGSQTAAPAGAALDDYFDQLDAAFAGIVSQGTPAKSAPAAPQEPLSDQIDWFGSHPDARRTNTEPWDLPKPDHLKEFEIDSPAASAAGVSYASPKSPFESSAPIKSAPEPAPTPVAAAAQEVRSVEPPVRTPQPVAAVAEPKPAAPTPAAAPVSTAAPAPSPVSVPPAPKASSISSLSSANSSGALPPLADAFAALLAAERGEGKPLAAPQWPASAPSPDDLIDKVVRQVLDRLTESSMRETVADVVSQIAERLVREEIERIKASVK
jgi:CheY-like chemotaxis protein